MRIETATEILQLRERITKFYLISQIKENVQYCLGGACIGDYLIS